MVESSGALLYREGARGLEVLLVEPSGFAARYGWSIPKGLIDEGESKEAAARRETLEETGVAAGRLRYLGHIDYRKSRKRVHCYAGPAPDEEPRKASFEVRQARFLPLEEARRRLHPDQRAFLDLLVQRRSG